MGSEKEYKKTNMSFTSTFFLLGLLPWYLLISIPLRSRPWAAKILLGIANAVFYLWSGAGGLCFLCAFTLLVWCEGKLLMTFHRRALFWASLLITAAPLIAIKYTGFLIRNLNTFLPVTVPQPSLLTPLGISFFTFEAISYLADIYRGEIVGKVSVPEVFLYLSFFPTVTSGPILRFSGFRDRLEHPTREYPIEQSMGRIVIGLCKKVLIADKLAPLANYYFDGIAAGNSFSTSGLWIGAFAYTLQLYFDFSGYSDIAIGIGRSLGFDMIENFNRPYLASSISDFWRRWHISLSQWFRDYVYIPLGGSRCSKSRQILNLLAVWFLTGIWHGAEWSFVVWGLGYFILLVLEKSLPAFRRMSERWYGHLYTLFFVNLLWIPFRADNLRIAGRYLAGMFCTSGTWMPEQKTVRFLPYLILAAVLCAPLEKNRVAVREYRITSVLRSILVCILGVMAICAIVNATYAPYIYGAF